MKHTKPYFSYLISSLLFSILVLFLTACSPDEIKKPPLQEPKISYVQKDSVIQMPIILSTKTIEQAILKKLRTPLSKGISEKMTLNMLKNFLELSIEINHKVYLKDLKLNFKDSEIHILSSYLIDLSLDYEQEELLFTPPFKVKGLLDGKVSADLKVIGHMSINSNAELTITIPEEGAIIEFTRVEIPSILNKLDYLKLAKAELYLTKKLIVKSINKQIIREIQKQISQKQVAMNIHSKIRKLVLENSSPIPLSKDTWVLPQLQKISLSQITGEGKDHNNQLCINVGVTAKPKIITSITPPKNTPQKLLPIIVESFEPKVYLYPSIHLEYTYIEEKIEKEFRRFLKKKYPDSDYSITNISLYPSNEKLVVAIDLIEKDTTDKILTFYLWGIPKLDTKNKLVHLEDFAYTLESKNTLIEVADWLLDQEIKDFIQEKTVFRYEKKLSKLSNKFAKIEKKTKSGTLYGKMEPIRVKSIFTAKDALIINALSQGQISYTVDLKNTKRSKRKYNE